MLQGAISIASWGVGVLLGDLQHPLTRPHRPLLSDLAGLQHEVVQLQGMDVLPCWWFTCLMGNILSCGIAGRSIYFLK